MRRLTMALTMALILTLSSCVYGSGGEAPDMGNAPDTDTSMVETTTVPTPEIPNVSEDGYSKRY